MKNLFILSFFFMTTAFAFGQSVTITPNASGASIIDVSSTDKGFLPPRMTTAQRNAIISPTSGLLVYDTDLKDIYMYDIAWVKATFTTAPLELTSNTVTPIKGVNSLGGSNNSGVMGETTSNTGGTGVYGVSSTINPTGGGNWGVYGENLSVNDLGYGVYARHWGAGTALQAQSLSGTSVRSVSQSGMAGEFITSSDIALALAGTALGKGTAIRGNATQEGVGVHGISSTGTALFGFSGTGNGLYAETNGGTAATARIVNNNGTGKAIDANNNSAANPTLSLTNANANGRALEINGQIRIPSGGSNRAIFNHGTAAANIVGNYTILSYPNALVTDFLMVTQTIGAGGNPNVIGVNYAGGAWTIYNVNGNPMPVNTAYNVLVIKQ